MELRLNPDLQARLDHLAAQQGRDTVSLACVAIERLVNYDEWFLLEVDKGLAQLDRRQVLTHEQVGKRLEKRLSNKSS